MERPTFIAFLLINWHKLWQVRKQGKFSIYCGYVMSGTNLFLNWQAGWINVWRLFVIQHLLNCDVNWNSQLLRTREITFFHTIICNKFINVSLLALTHRSSPISATATGFVPSGMTLILQRSLCFCGQYCKWCEGKHVCFFTAKIKPISPLQILKKWITVWIKNDSRVLRLVFDQLAKYCNLLRSKDFLENRNPNWVST